MTKLLVKNSKIAKSNNDAYIVYNFGIPAYQSKSGFRTCPMAGKCAQGCYARSGAYIWNTVAQAYEHRLEMSFKPDFGAAIERELKPKVTLAQRQSKQLAIRIHDSGDFYSPEYLDKWLEVINNHPSIIFYAYSKMVPLFKAYIKRKLIPNNLIIIFSEGGLKDKSINTEIERHCRVFPNKWALERAGYADASENDLIAIGANKKVGIVWHGINKSKKWTTNKEI